MLGWVFGSSEAPNNQLEIEEIFTKYERLMFCTAAKFTKNVEDQKDIVQTAMERLLRITSAPGVRKRCLSAGYIVFTIRSVSIDFLRKQSRETAHCINIDDDQLAQIPSADHPLEELLQSSDTAQQLWSIWPQLPIEDQILLEGKYILDYTAQELANTLGCKSSSIRMKLTRARRRAARLLSERMEL